MDWLCGGEDREGHPIDSILFASRDVPHRTCPPRGGQGRQTMDLVGLPPSGGQGRHPTDLVFFLVCTGQLCPFDVVQGIFTSICGQEMAKSYYVLILRLGGQQKSWPHRELGPWQTFWMRLEDRGRQEYNRPGGSWKKQITVGLAKS